MFDVNSRYYQLEDKFLTTESGDVITYKKRRFLPALTKRNNAISQIKFVQGDRLDLIAHRTLGNSLNFWQIADVNTVMHPGQLTEEVGKFIKTPLIPIQIIPN